MELKLSGSRKGYVHALEGVIAAILVVVYLNAIVSAPTPTDWESAEISKRSEDLMSAMDRSGFLDRVVLEDDRESFNAFVNSLDSSLSYRIKLAGLPKRHISVGILVNNSSTYTADTTQFSNRTLGVPKSEDGSGYRGGTLTGEGFNTLEFNLSDTVDNGIRKYTSVNFDFDGDGDFDGTDEGPYNFSDRFTCQDSATGCSGSEVYEVGRSNSTLVLHEGEDAHSLDRDISRVSIGGRPVEFSYRMVNPYYGFTDDIDVLWVEDWSVDELEDHRETVERFLGDGRLLFLHSDFVKSDIDSNYLSELGFDYLEQYEVEGSGNTDNVLHSIHGAGNESYRSSQYYLDSSLEVNGFTDAGGYEESSIEIRGNSITVRRWGQEVAFGSESFSINYSVGDTVVLESNSFDVEEIKPLRLSPAGMQRFDPFGTERIESDYHLTRMEGRTYNITVYDTSSSYSQEFQKKSGLPQDYDRGPVNTDCDGADYPYRFGDIDIEGESYNFSIVNFEPRTPCDSYFEFVYFDLNKDGDFSDDELTGFSKEGPHQSGYVINFSGSLYELDPQLEGKGIDMKKMGPRLVGEIPVSRDISGEGGSAALLRRPDLGDEDLHLITSLMAVETQEELEFTRKRSLGDTSISYVYTSSSEGQNSYGYVLDTVWWSQ
ncbi:MAG: hypothetical protein MUP63_04095 [Candidatus Nanohaloarchaeota archaeon QJJ-7]|nr:hypothetical protein [Candidatus Nanohaloarchaeota archaeon QJJ-7]